MPNFTIEDYKTAIQKKYEKEIVADKFPNPSQANLRDLCWEIYEKNQNPDDISVFKSFFGFEFDLTKRNQFKTQTDRFRPIGNFYKRKTDLADKNAANLAAVLVDFQPRPFRKFRERGVIDYEMQSNPENSPPPQPFITKEEVNFEFKEIGLPKAPQPFIGIQEEGDSNLFNEESKYLNSGQDITFPLDENKLTKTDEVKIGKERKLNILNNRSFITSILILLIASGIGMYLVSFYKPCMQWSGDHFEKVSCDLEVNGIGNFNVVEPFDKTIFDLKKINVCDTTPCFDKNGEAVVWYAKTANGIDFFNGHGRHPETNSPLRPVTRYILNKYVKK